ncbi:MAG: Crp/Fnr family transcriptional regulator [Oleispira sp.]
MSILFKCRQLKPLGEEICQNLWQHSTIMDVGAAEYIWQKGSNVKSVFILLEGSVYFSEIDEAGNETVYYPQYPTNLFGESEVFLECNKYNNYARTISKCKIAVLDKSRLIQQIEASPGYLRWWLTEMTGRVQLVKRLRMATTINSPEDRVVKTLITAYEHVGSGEEECSLPYTQDIFANLLGLSRRVVNKVLNNLASQGYIKLEYGKVIVNDSILQLR